MTVCPLLFTGFQVFHDVFFCLEHERLILIPHSIIQFFEILFSLDVLTGFTMENENQEAILIEAVNKCADEQGWANLAELGTLLKENGVQYKKLRKFLNAYNHLVEIRMDNSVAPPVAYAKVINNPDSHIP